MAGRKLWASTWPGLVPLGLFLAVAGVAQALPPATASAGTAERVELLPMPAPDGRPVALKPPPAGATALIFYWPECPISNAYSPTLNQLAAEFPANKVRFVGVCVDPELSDSDVATHAKDFGLTFPIVRDRRALLASKIGATVTPEAFVVDAKGKVRYHGRIDDQFAARGKANANPATHELHDALAAVVAGKDVAVPHVPAVGCPLPVPAKPAQTPTYAQDVARILQKNCLECHRKGQVGPFALETYEQARKRAADIAGVTEARSMPPWKPTPGFGQKLKHDRSLSEADIATLATWATAGAPQGDPAETPPAPKFADDWALGTPDLVIEPSEDFEVPADGSDVYRCFVIPTDLPEDRFIEAIEYRPGNRAVVHHMLAYVDVKGQARQKDTAEPGPGYTCFSGPGIEIHGDLGGWAPGNEPSRLPEGVGRSLPRKADVVVQVHYHPNGKPEKDRSRIGLHFSRKPVKQTFHWNAAADLGLKIPAGAANHVSKARWEVPVDLVAYAVTPHMHLLGRDMTLTVTYPDGKVVDLIKIDDWDFAWQNNYYFDKPLDLPKGSVLNLLAHFDNSASNPRNQFNPPKEVTWGEATTDEMSIGFIGVVKKGQDLTRPGEKDDLQDIFNRQNDERERKYKERQERARAARGN